MSTTSAKDGQTLLDIQIVNAGGMEGIIAMCALNNLSVTDDLADGQTLMCAGVVSPKVAAQFANLLGEPATALAQGAPKMGGIGYMAVGVDFIVS
ncbi:MAG: hypothetical protein HUK01_07130 [Bacteroidaceae bacterium]|nr:hypothetical protein [Bacteroidaceae bacterium]